MKSVTLTAAIATITILPLMVMPFASADFLYYIILIILAALRLRCAESASILLLCTLICAAIGILLRNPLPIFRPWERLGLFACMLAGIGPLFSGGINAQLSQRLFQNLALSCLLVGALSACCAAIGINRGGAVFSGLTPHSMILGPVAGIGFLYAMHKTMHCYAAGKGLPGLLMTGGIACLAALLLSSSRSALLSTTAGAAYLILRVPRGRGLILLLSGFTAFLLLPFAGELTEGLFHKMDSSREAGSIFSSRAELWSDRWQEFREHPLFGVGFASQSIISFSHSLQSGIIEPGSSYLGCLSMLGLVGSLPLFMLLATALRHGMRKTAFPPLAVVVLLFFCVHMIFEGYLISAGSVLCVLLWSCISATLAGKT